MRRREALVGLAATTLHGMAAAQDIDALLRAGGCAVLLRHAQTVPGIGDPPGFRVDFCSTQRNLSEEGRADARRMGEWFKARQLQPRAVRSSAWCRCRDTADLAFGRHIIWTALNSTFGDRVLQPDQTALVKAALARVPSGQFDVWVTHQVNISALTGEGPAMGEAFILDGQGTIMARTRFA